MSKTLEEIRRGSNSTTQVVDVDEHTGTEDIEQIMHNIDKACNKFLNINKLQDSDAFIVNCSTTSNHDLYTNRIMEDLKLTSTGTYNKPWEQKDMAEIDLFGYIPMFIRNYRVPILYFVDSITSFKGNSTWKSCRENFNDIVIDIHANIELLSKI